MRFSGPLLPLALAFALTVGMGTTAARAVQSDSDKSVASIDEYLKANPDFRNTCEFPGLGIEVIDGEDTLQHRYRLDGIEVLAVLPGSPGAAAGLRGERAEVQAALTVGLLAASLFFPPAILAAAVLGSSGVGRTYELIVAVDGERTHDITEFGAALDQAEPGEVVYLTVVSDGQRKQLRVPLPDDRYSHINRR